MKRFIQAFVIILTLLLAIDSIWITFMYERFYSANIGHLIAEEINLRAALIFYMIYSAGLAVLVILPSLKHNETSFETFARGLLFGLVAYGSYDLTNHATLRDWPVIVTGVDLVWGTLLTGLVTLISLKIMQKIVRE